MVKINILSAKFYAIFSLIILVNTLTSFTVFGSIASAESGDLIEAPAEVTSIEASSDSNLETDTPSAVSVFVSELESDVDSLPSASGQPALELEDLEPEIAYQTIVESEVQFDLNDPVEIEDNNQALNPLDAIKIIKVQVGDSSLDADSSAAEFIVIKNIGPNLIDLKGWLLKISSEADVKKVEFLVQQSLLLAPGEQLYFINGYLPIDYYQQIDSSKIIKLGTNKTGYINKTGGKIRLYDVMGHEQLFYYSNEADIPGAVWLEPDKDLLAWSVDEAGQLVYDQNELPVYDSLLAKDPAIINVPWLKIDQLPVQVEFESAPEPEPIIVHEEQSNDDQPTEIDEEQQIVCPLGYEIGFTGTCVKICGIGYERNATTNRCRMVVEVEDEPKACPVGYERNPETNRCRKIVIVQALASCQDGYYRNPETNRCNKIQVTVASALKACPVGYERNPETNRCRKVDNQQFCEDGYEIGFTGTCVKLCDQGYERSVETNRCRKTVAMASDDELEKILNDTSVGNAIVETPVLELGWPQVALVGFLATGLITFLKRDLIFKWLSRWRN